jgi:uncharacterized membrane protein
MTEAESDRSWSSTYWMFALPAWLVVTFGGVVWALVASRPWTYPVSWSFGWLVFVLALWWAIDTMRPYRQHVDSPETSLRRRLASGEIDEAEYQSRLNALRGPQQ